MISLPHPIDQWSEVETETYRSVSLYLNPWHNSAVQGWSDANVDVKGKVHVLQWNLRYNGVGQPLQCNVGCKRWSTSRYIWTEKKPMQNKWAIILYGPIQLCAKPLKTSAQAQPWLLNEDVLLAKVQRAFQQNYKTASLSLHMYSVDFEAETWFHIIVSNCSFGAISSLAAVQ